MNPIDIRVKGIEFRREDGLGKFYGTVEITENSVQHAGEKCVLSIWLPGDEASTIQEVQRAVMWRAARFLRNVAKIDLEKLDVIACECRRQDKATGLVELGLRKGKR